MKGFFYNDFANAERGPGVVVGGFASFAKGRKFGEAGTSLSVVKRGPIAGAAA